MKTISILFVLSIFLIAGCSEKAKRSISEEKFQQSQKLSSNEKSNIPTIQRIEVGQPMAMGKLCDPQSKLHRIADEYKGKYLLLEFWSVGCGPCREAFPKLRKIQKKYKDKLTIIGINIDTRKMWKEGLQKFHLPWIHLSDYKGMEGYAGLYGFYYVPFYVLISPDGIVQKKWRDIEEEQLKDIL